VTGDPLAPVNLPDDLVQRINALQPSQPLLLCCDFDGTLAPIVSRPEDAQALPGVDQLLTEIAAAPNTTVAVVSGRALADLQRLTGLSDPVVLIGSHGAESAGGFADPITPEQTETMAELDRTLSGIVAGVPGAQLEHKPISIAVHVRNVEDRDRAAAVLEAVSTGPAQWPGIHATAGKEVLELAVQRVDKTSAVEMIRSAVPDAVALFVGDDVTDERAFRALPEGDITVKVGEGETAARYRIASPEAVRGMLALIAGIR
jgi:trehalose 6-phosphate phosphatase